MPADDHTRAYEDAVQALHEQAHPTGPTDWRRCLEHPCRDLAQEVS